MDLHMPNKIGMSKSEYDSSFKWCHIRSSLWLRLVDLRSHVLPVGIKGTFWALIDLSLFAIGPNLHCPRVFRSLHLFLFLWLAIIDHSLHIWSTLLFHFWIRTDWNFLEIINGIISLLYNMITLWPIFIYNLINRVNSVENIGGQSSVVKMVLFIKNLRREVKFYRESRGFLEIKISFLAKKHKFWDDFDLKIFIGISDYGQDFPTNCDSHIIQLM